MIYFLLPALSLLLLWLLAGAALPFMVWLEHRQAVSKQRSLYAKSADQLARLTFWVQSAAALALALDFGLGGSINDFAVGMLRPFWLALAVASVTASVYTVLSNLIRQTRADVSRQSNFLIVLSGLCALVGAFGFVVLAWVFLRGPLLPVLSEVAEISPIAIIKVLFTGQNWQLAALFALACITLAPAAGNALGLCWHIMRRKQDDFGRDYYSKVTARRARKGAYAGALSLLPSALMLWLTPVFSAERLASIAPISEQTAFWVCNMGSLCLPLAVLCLYLVAHSPLPMQKKSLIFLAPLLMWVAVWSLLARLWV